MSPLLVTIIFTSMAQMVFAGMRLAVALDAIAMGSSPAVVGSITALFGLLPALGSLYVGRFIDRNGTKALTLVCPLILAAAALLAAALPSLAALALASLATGAAFLTVHIINQQLVGRLSKPEDRPANFALTGTWASASSTFGPIAAGFAIDHIGFRWTFGAMGLLPLLSLALLSRLPRLTGRVPTENQAASGSIITLVSGTKLRHIYVVNVLFATAWDVLLFMMPIYGAELKLSASQIGIIISCFSGAVFVVRLLARAVTRRFTPWQVLLACLVVSGSANLAFGLSGTAALLMLFAFTMGMGHGLANPMMNTLLYEASPPSRVAEVMGLRTSVSMGLQFIMPIAAGSLGAFIGIAPLFWLVSASQVGAAVAWRRNWHLKRVSGAVKTTGPQA